MSTCVFFGDKGDELISAAIDGELDREESKLLEAHLNDCAICSQRMKAFKQIDCLAKSQNVSFFANGKSVELAKMEKKVSSKFGNSFSLRWWQTALALASVVLVAFSLSWILNVDDVPRDSGMYSLGLMKVINEQIEEDHQSMLELLQLELRMLKLEAANSQLPSEESERLDQRIRDLIRKSEQLKFKLSE